MKSSINFRVVKGGLKFSGSPYSGGKLSLKNRAPNMVHLGAVRLNFRKRRVDSFEQNQYRPCDRTNDAELTPKPVSALHFRFYRIGAEPNLYP
jgi:hypothetical protein